MQDVSDGRLVLRELRQSDYEALYSMSHDDEVYRFVPPWVEDRKLRDNLSVLISEMGGLHLAEDRPFLVGIAFDDASSQLVGLAELYDYDRRHRCVSLGYRLRREFWGCGMAGNAVSLLLRYLSESGCIDTAYAEVAVENTASSKVLLHNGFRLFGEPVPADWGQNGPAMVLRYRIRVPSHGKQVA